MANKNRRCLHCKEYKEADSGIIKPVGFFCCLDHMIQYAASKGKANHAKKERKATKIAREGLKTHRQKLAEAQPVFNELIRMQEFKWFKDRGLEPTCISCQKPIGGDIWCAGHLKTAGAHTNTRFDPLNVWLQHNVKCNMHESGDIEGYKLGLAARFGNSEAAIIIEHCTIESKKTRTYSDNELAEMKKAWRKETRELKEYLK